jgi:transposase-like protein
MHGRAMSTEYSDQIKAQALAALLAGQAPSEVARLYNIPVGTLKSWKSRQLRGDSVATVATDVRERIGLLLLTYLEETLYTLTIQQKAFRNEEWLYKQSAAEAATLHGISVDKAVRLLEGLADSDAPDPEQDAA